MRYHASSRCFAHLPDPSCPPDGKGQPGENENGKNEPIGYEQRGSCEPRSSGANRKVHMTELHGLEKPVSIVGSREELQVSPLPGFAESPTLRRAGILHADAVGHAFNHDPMVRARAAPPGHLAILRETAAQVKNRITSKPAQKTIERIRFEKGRMGLSGR